MDQNLRQSIQTNTFYYFLIVMVLTTISQLSTMMVIVFGNVTGKELLVSASVVGPTLIGAFGIIRLLTSHWWTFQSLQGTCWRRWRSRSQHRKCGMTMICPGAFSPNPIALRTSIRKPWWTWVSFIYCTAQ